MTEIVPIERITDKICPIRSQKVIIDHDLAELYGVETKQLKRAVRAGRAQNSLIIIVMHFLHQRPL